MIYSLSKDQEHFQEKNGNTIPFINDDLDVSNSTPPLKLVVLEGQLKVHSASFRGSFPDVFSEALRAAGLGRRVMVAQLLKGGVDQGLNGAINLCGQLKWIRPAISCCINQQVTSIGSDPENNKNLSAVKEIWNTCKEHLLKRSLDQLVLDEIGLAISLGYLEEKEVISILQERPMSMDVILTGPEIPSSLMGIADQVTLLRCGS